MGLAGAMRSVERERGDPLYPLYSLVEPMFEALREEGGEGTSAPRGSLLPWVLLLLLGAVLVAWWLA